MGGKWTPFFSYIAGAPLGVNHALFTVAEDTAEAKAVKFSQFLEWKEGIWSDGGTADWSTVSIDSVVMDGTVVIAGPSGEVRYAGGGAHRDENIF
ncbi:MAG TPA: hypothetical protein VFW23_08820, partial [Tepidisphaeraceae bacterium]|nr:hypothetical protein [Tepidisphaeraceae bacterium]